MSDETGSRRKAAAQRASAAVLEALHELATCDNDDLRPLPLGALSALAHPSSLEVLVEAAGRPSTRAPALAALSAFDTPGSLRLLVELLESHRDHPDRMEALVPIGAMTCEGVDETLRELATSDDPALREGAARAMAQRDGAAVEASLLALLEDSSKDVAVAALLALREVGTDNCTVPLLRVLQNSKNVFVRSTAMLTLGRLAPAEAHAAVRKHVKDPDDRIRASAVEALGRGLAENLDDVPVLIEALRDEHNRVVGNAIVGLWEVDKDVCLKPFSNLMKSPRKVWRSTAAWILGEVQAPELFQAYLPVINTETDKDVVAMAMRSIEQASNPRLVSTMSKLLTHPNAEMRVRATKAFARMARSSDRRALLSALTKERDPRVKAAMLTTLGALSDGTNFPDIFPFLDEDDPRVVANAVQALGEVGDLAVAPVLRDNLSSKHPRTRVNAIVALARVGDLEVLPGLAEMVAARDLEEMRSGCFGAQNLGLDLRAAIQGEGRFPPLEAALDELGAGLDDEALRAATSEVAPAVDRSAEWELAFARSLRGEGAPAPPTDAGDGPAAAAWMPKARATDGELVPQLLDAFKRERFLPGLFLGLERARQAGDPKVIQARYLDVAHAQLGVLEELVSRTSRRFKEGEAARVYKLLDFVLRQLTVGPDVHRSFGIRYLGLKEYDLAYHHLLQAYAANPDDHELLLQAAGAAIRIQKHDMARELLSTLRARLPPDSPLIARAEKLGSIAMSSKPPGRAER